MPGSSPGRPTTDQPATLSKAPRITAATSPHWSSIIAASDGVFAAIADTGFTNVVFAWVPLELRPLDVDVLTADQHARLYRLAPTAKARMQTAGDALLGYQPVHGLNTWRLLVMNPAVTTDDIDAVFEAIAGHSATEWPGC